MTPGMLTESALAVVLGCAFGVGVCLLISLAPRVSAPSLSRRIMPYIRDVIDPQGLGPLASPAASVRDTVREMLGRLSSLVGGAEALGRRLSQAGWPTDAATFRSRQVLWGLAGVAGGGVLVVCS